MVVVRPVPGCFAVARLAHDSAWPHWAGDSIGLLSISRTSAETSVVCEERLIPEGISKESGFVAFVVDGPIDFAATGVLATLAVPLASASISIFAVSTFDTDYVLVRATDAASARAAWRAAGVIVAD